jgi:ribosome biogenesis GTPase / thiamine phosphate phosphatase
MSASGLLVRHGWDDGWASLVAGGDVPARIVRVDRGECDVVTGTGAERVLSDSTRAQADVAPATGDWVLLTDGSGDKRAIARVLPRRHTLVRRDPSEAVVDQVLVANVDTVAIVHGLDRPMPPGRLERFLVQAWDSGADPLVVLTKADRASSPEDLAEQVATAQAIALDVPVFATRRDDGSIGSLRNHIPAGRTLALVGASGVGKSTLVNLLVGEEVQPTREVRERDAKGRHTTTARELLLVPGGGAVVDTPGVRAVGVWADEDALHRVFSDVEELAEQCRFSDCAHDREPGCAVRGVVEPRRLARYRSLLAEIDEMRERSRARRRG